MHLHATSHRLRATIPAFGDFHTVADLIIPATLRTWLVFLLLFILLGYPVPFSILFGISGGVAGGLTTAWWQVKGKGPGEAGKPKLPIMEANGDDDAGDRTDTDDKPRWELPFLGPSKSKKRYLERNRRAKNRRIR